MPAKNSIKIYVDEGFYHVYNRGVNKDFIFKDEYDYKAFLYYLNLYLLPKEVSIKKIQLNKNLTELEKNKKMAKIFQLNNFYKKIEILCYVLMPNHFHLLLKQNNKNDIKIFLKSLLTKYAQYFNKKYQRVGPVFQGRYKAILIDKKEYFLHLSRYIHLNPKELLKDNQKLIDYQWSSYRQYLEIEETPEWLKKEYILSDFKNNKGFGFDSYQGFVEGFQEADYEENNEFKRLILD